MEEEKRSLVVSREKLLNEKSPDKNKLWQKLHLRFNTHRCELISIFLPIVTTFPYILVYVSNIMIFMQAFIVKQFLVYTLMRQPLPQGFSFR